MQLISHYLVRFLGGCCAVDWGKAKPQIEDGTRGGNWKVEALFEQHQPFHTMKVLSSALSAAILQGTLGAAQGYTDESEVLYYGLSPPVYPSRKSRVNRKMASVHSQPMQQLIN